MFVHIFILGWRFQGCQSSCMGVCISISSKEIYLFINQYKYEIPEAPAKQREFTSQYLLNRCLSLSQIYVCSNIDTLQEDLGESVKLQGSVHLNIFEEIHFPRMHNCLNLHHLHKHQVGQSKRYVMLSVKTSSGGAGRRRHPSSCKRVYI